MKDSQTIIIAKPNCKQLYYYFANLLKQYLQMYSSIECW